VSLSLVENLLLQQAVVTSVAVYSYDVLNSGCPNFLVVALALHDLGHVAKGETRFPQPSLLSSLDQSLGVRLDSGDLAYQSKMCRSIFDWAAER